MKTYSDFTKESFLALVENFYQANKADFSAFDDGDNHVELMAIALYKSIMYPGTPALPVLNFYDEQTKDVFFAHISGMLATDKNMPLDLYKLVYGVRETEEDDNY